MKRAMTTTQTTRPVQASLSMIAAMMVIGVIDNFIPRIAQDIGLWQFHFTRALIAAPFVIALAAIGLGRLGPRRWGAVILRSLCIAVSMLFYFSALALMPIAQALAGLFTSPIFILLITGLFMGQKVGPWRILAVALGFAGTLIVLQPDLNDFDWAVMIPVAGGFFYALAAIATRTICAGESTVALLAGMWVALCLVGLVGLLVLQVYPIESADGPLGFVTRGWVWPMKNALPFVALQAIGSVTGVFLIIKAYQIGEPSFVSVFEYSVMVFGPLFAWVAFGQSVGPAQILGIALIVVAGSIIAVRSN